MQVPLSRFEYAAETKALVLATQCQLLSDGVDDLGLPAARVNIGEDIEVDVQGAKIMGMRVWSKQTLSPRRPPQYLAHAC